MTCPGAHSLDRESLGCAPRCPAPQSGSPQVPPLRLAGLRLPPREDGRTCVGGWNPWAKKEPPGLWLQIPGQVTEDKHKFPDRVRLPRSLFAALQGSRPVVPLAVSVLDVGPGSLFKVRSRTEGRAARRLPRRCLSSVGSPSRHRMAMEKAMSLCSSRPSQTHL